MLPVIPYNLVDCKISFFFLAFETQKCLDLITFNLINYWSDLT